MLTPGEQDELVPVGTSWRREDGGVDVVLSERSWFAGVMTLSYTTYWEGRPGQGYGSAQAVHFAATRKKLDRAPHWTGVIQYDEPDLIEGGARAVVDR